MGLGRIIIKRWDLTSQQIMAFGDSENDVEMLEMAGIAYAMENADNKAKSCGDCSSASQQPRRSLSSLGNWLEKGE